MGKHIFLEEDQKKLSEYQSVKQMDTIEKEHPTWNKKDVTDEIRRQATYSMEDEWKQGVVKDDCIYISVTNDQHQEIVDYSTGKKEELGKLGLGFFTDEATVKAAWTPEGLDNTKLNEMCQIAPFHENDKKRGIDEYNYKPHMDCFIVDRDRLEEVYGTREFPAMLSECHANDANSPGGGNQGYNHLIDEMISEGVLKHAPEKSYSREDRALLSRDGKSVTLNDNALVNNTITKKQYTRFVERRDERAKDCIENNSRHPSPEVCKKSKAPGEPVKLSVEPCSLAAEPAKKEFLDTLQKYVDDFVKAGKPFTLEDEAQLDFYCRKQMKQCCEQDAGSKNGTQAEKFMCNENVKNYLRPLEKVSKGKSFKVDKFCEKTVDRFNHPRDPKEANEKFRKDARKSGIELDSKMLSLNENIKQITGDYSTMSEISQASKGSSKLIEDKNVVDFANEARTQQQLPDIHIK